MVAGFAPPVVRPTPIITSAPGLRRSWEGINALTMSEAQGFTFTPPDQGLWATTPGGTGVMDFTLAGHDYYPAQGYIPWSPTGPTTGIAQTVPGAAPLDDFCQYNFFNCAGTATPTARPRYGDYSWATFMNGNVYIANEAVASRCSFAQFNNDLTCGGTRAPLTNWSTRISVIRP